MNVKIEIADEVINDIKDQLKSISENLNRIYDENKLQEIVEDIVIGILNRYLSLEYISQEELESCVYEYFNEKGDIKNE
jgi:hypothetical protein